MQNDSSLEVSIANRHVARKRDNYQVVNSYKTRVLNDEIGTRVFFHDTPVVSFNDRSILLNTGGWRTRSTKVRMNQASQEFALGFRVFQKKNDWFVGYRNNTFSFVSDELILERQADSRIGGETDA